MYPLSGASVNSPNPLPARFQGPATMLAMPAGKSDSPPYANPLYHAPMHWHVACGDLAHSPLQNLQVHVTMVHYSA